jgi:hypothetical protein
MAIPCLDIQYLKTTSRNTSSGLITRFTFQWMNRRQLGPVTLRLDLLDARGKLVLTSRTKLPKVRVTGYKPATAREPALPLYDGPTALSLERLVDDEQHPPTAFRYTTESGAYKKSDVIVGSFPSDEGASPEPGAL